MIINVPATNGDVYEELVTKYTTDIQLVSEGLVEVVTTLNKASEYSFVLRSAENLDVDYNPCLISNGELNFETKQITLGKTALFYDKILPSEWENVVRKWQPTGTIVNEQLAAPILKDLFLTFTEEFNEVMNRQTIGGVQTPVPGMAGQYRRFDGVMTQAKATGSGVEKVAYAAVTNAAGAVALLEKLRKGVDVRVRRQKNFKYAVSPAIFDLYLDSQYSAANKGVDITENGVARYKGNEVHVLDELEDNEAFATVMSTNSDSNLIMVYAGEDSATSFEYGRYDVRCEYYMLKMIWKSGLGIKKPEEMAVHVA